MRATAHLFFLFASLSAAQVPQIFSDGIVNSASWATPVAPGSLVSIFGSNLATTTLSAVPPFPLKLGGTSVTISGVPAVLSFVSPGQINLQIPSSLTVPSGQGIPGGSSTAVVTTSAGVSPAATFGISNGTPGFFTKDGSGCGQAAALNITPNGAVSVNSPSNSAAPGDYIALFGTGLGLATPQPADGVAPTGAAPLQLIPGLFLNNILTPVPSYAGLAPSLVGVDQINFQLPASTRNGCTVPISASQTFGSPPVTISVQGGRGQCIDPPIQSYGQISMNKEVFSTPGIAQQPSESLFAMFPSGPAIQPPAPPTVVFAPEWVGDVSFVTAGIFLSPFPVGPSFSRTCTVPGYAQLSAGVIQMTSPGGMSVAANPNPTTDGVNYAQSLPVGFLGPGNYTLSGAQGSAVNLQTSVHVGSPIQIQTPLTGTVISNSQPLTIKWTGGDPGTLVELVIYSGQSSLYTYANATDGSLTIAPYCTADPVAFSCSFGLPLATNAQVGIEVLPGPANITSVTVPGITGKVQINWSYSYNFSGLTVGP